MKNNLITKVNDLKAEAQIIEYVLEKFPDARHETFANVFYLKNNLNFSTANLTDITNILAWGSKDQFMFFANAYHAIDKTKFNLSEEFSNTYKEIKVLTYNKIIGHYDDNNGYVLDDIHYTHFSDKNKSLKEEHIALIKTQFMNWVLIRSAAKSFKQLESDIRYLPEEFKINFQNHFILK